MLSVNSLDFLSYKNALKGNYRKGVYAFRTMLENPATAEAFASNPGGVALVLGWPIGYEDHNSAELLELLLGSSVIDQATLTWMAQWYADYADSWDTLASGLDRATFMAANPLIWRALGRSPMASGKVISTLAGLTCSQYADIAAVAADESAMEAVAASQVAMTAVAASQVAMTAVAASTVAMAAVAASATARNAVTASSTATNALANSSLKTTVDWTGFNSSNSYFTRRSGLCYIINVFRDSTTSYELTLRVYEGAAASVSEKAMGVVQNTPVRVDRFAPNIEAKLNNTTSSKYTVTFIPCA